MSEAGPDGLKAHGFFGRRKGPRLRAGQAVLFESLLPRLKPDISAPAPSADGFVEALFGRPMPAFWLEIGFGGGEHLIHQADTHPEIGFLGCEPFVNGMAKALAHVARKWGPVSGNTTCENKEEKSGDDAGRIRPGLDNVRLYDDEVAPLLDWLPPAMLDRVYLLYPDPWPKKRHWKRRFVSNANLDRLARVMKPGAELRFATDIADYADWALRHIHRHPAFEWTAERADDWRRPFEDWPGTRYEEKAKKAGRTPNYFVFRRIKTK